MLDLGPWMFGRAYFIAIGRPAEFQYAMRIRWFLPLLLIVSIFLAARYSIFAAAPNQLTEEEKAAGWKLLFDGKSTTGWRGAKQKAFPSKGWTIEDGWLHCLGKGVANRIDHGGMKRMRSMQARASNLST